MTVPHDRAGRFITLEGPDGSGKTLHAARLADRRLRLKLGPARHHVDTAVGVGYRFVQ